MRAKCLIFYYCCGKNTSLCRPSPPQNWRKHLRKLCRHFAHDREYLLWSCLGSTCSFKNTETVTAPWREGKGEGFAFLLGPSQAEEPSEGGDTPRTTAFGWQKSSGQWVLHRPFLLLSSFVVLCFLYFKRIIFLAFKWKMWFSDFTSFGLPLGVQYKEKIWADPSQSLDQVSLPSKCL